MRSRKDKESGFHIRTSNYNFYMDDEDVNREFVTDPDEMPPFETAEKLVQSYKLTVQNSFPVLAEQAFFEQFYQYYASVAQGQPIQINRKLQAIFNMVFAVGAVYSHLIEADWEGDGEPVNCYRMSMLTKARPGPPHLSL